MTNWRKQQGESHYQASRWRSSSYNRKPPLDKWHSTVPSWEKKFCYSVGSVPWRKLIECKRYMYLHDNVLNWDDSACKEAFDNAKQRFWAEINGLPCNLSLPDPDIHIDDVDWDSSVDPELYLDLEREPEVPSGTEVNDEEGVILSSALLNQTYTPPGWGDEEDEVAAKTPKPSEPFSGAQGNWVWNNNLNESQRVEDPWEQHYYEASAAEHHAREYEWQNNQNYSWGWNLRDQQQHYEWQNNQNYSWGWNLRDQQQHYYGGGVNGSSGYGHYYRKKENMASSWSKKTPPAAAEYYHGGSNEYHMNRGRRNNRGGRRRVNFGYDRTYMMDKVQPAPAEW